MMITGWEVGTATHMGIWVQKISLSAPKRAPDVSGLLSGDIVPPSRDTIPSLPQSPGKGLCQLQKLNKRNIAVRRSLWGQSWGRAQSPAQSELYQGCDFQSKLNRSENENVEISQKEEICNICSEMCQHCNCGHGAWGHSQTSRRVSAAPLPPGWHCQLGGRGMGRGPCPCPRTVCAGLFVPGPASPSSNPARWCLSWGRLPGPPLTMKTHHWVCQSGSRPSSSLLPGFSQHLSSCAGISHSLLAACSLGRRERGRGKLGGCWLVCQLYIRGIAAASEASNNNYYN